MRLRLKAKLTAYIALLVLLVVVAVSAVYIWNLTRHALGDVQGKGLYVARETYHQSQRVLAESQLPTAVNPASPQEFRQFLQSHLSGDGGLAAAMEAAVGYSPTILYVAITDKQQYILADSDPEQVGQSFAPAPPFSDLLNARLWRQLQVIYGPQSVYEVDLPLDMGGNPLGDVRVGVSTLFLRSELAPQLRQALLLTLVVILLATFSAALLSFWLMRPLQTIAHGVERLARGEDPGPLVLHRRDEWGVLSSKLNLLGEHMRGEKAAYLRLKENLDQLFANLADGLMLFDQQDRLVLATPAVARFITLSPEQALHRPAAEVFAGEAPLDRLLREAFQSRQPLVRVPASGADDGGTPEALVSAHFVEERGKPVAALVTLQDASTREQLQDQIDLAAKLTALARITSGVAHEVKNPLNAMVLQVELLKSKLSGEGEAVKPQLDILTKEIQRLDRVVKTFLDFTRPVELHPSETDLGELVREVFTLAEPNARAQKVRLQLEGDGKASTVRADRDLLKQALLNLVLNGCQAMPAGGELRVRPRLKGDRVELEISDQGVGIPPEARDKIFSLFFSTKPSGTGVGLAMAYRIVQLHNGSIDFTSEPSRGTTFRISLPV